MELQVLYLLLKCKSKAASADTYHITATILPYDWDCMRSETKEDHPVDVVRYGVWYHIIRTRVVPRSTYIPSIGTYSMHETACTVRYCIIVRYQWWPDIHHKLLHYSC